MPTAPYSKLRVSVNGGAPQTGGIVVANGAQIALSAESTVGWGEPAARWEIYAFPEGWTGPGAPWTSEAVPQPNGSIATVYKYLGTSPPPPFTMPALPLWGKFMLRLFVNGGIKGGAVSTELNDQSTALEILSPNGLHDMAWREGSQFGAWRNWVAHYAANLRLIDTGLSSVATSVQGVTGTAPITVTGTATHPIIGIAPASGASAGSLSSGFFTVLNTRTSDSTADTLALRDNSGGCAFTNLVASVIDSPGDLEIRRAGEGRLVFEEDAIEMQLPAMVAADDEYAFEIEGDVNKDTGAGHAIYVNMNVDNSGDGLYYITFARNDTWDMCIGEGGLIKWLDQSAPLLYHVPTSLATGNTFNIWAQNANATGADIVLKAGAGGLTQGGVKFWSGSHELAKAWWNGSNGVLDVMPGSGTRFDIRTAASQAFSLQYSTTKRIEIDSNGIGFFAATPVAKPTVTGSRGGNAALASLLTALANLGLIVNSSTA